MGNARRNKKHTDRPARPGSRVSAQSGHRPTAGGGRPANPDALRVLWYSNAPFTNTGYGQQTAQIIPRLLQDQHEVAIHAMYGLEGSTSMWNGVKLYPRGLAPYSDDIMVAHWMDWANGNRALPPILMTLFDVWVFKSATFDQVPNIASWVPIDHAPVPPDVLAWLDRKNVMPIAMSKFGSRMLDKAGVKHEYAPHGIESTFKPTTHYSNGRLQATGRELMGIDDDKFVVMMNAANKGVNPSRKAFAENMLAFGIFAQTHPEAVLYLHTEANGSMGGISLLHLAEACGIRPEQMKIVDQYAYRAGFPQEALAAMYTASDVLLSCSMGEGFGLAVIEAQACGTRVIVSDFTAQPELVGSGWTVEVQPFWDAAQRSWFCTPHVPSIVDALKRAYEAPRGTDETAVGFASQYQSDAVYEASWRPIMANLATWCRSSL